MKFINLFLASCITLALTNSKENLLRIFKLVTSFYTLEPDTFIEKFNKINTTLLMARIYNLDETIEPKKLVQPRYFQHVSLNEIPLNLNNSLVGACFQESIKNGKCTCSSTYSNTLSVFNKKDKVQTVITLNNQLRQIVVSHRPTLHLYNAMDALSFNQTSTNFAPSNVKVHKGFLSAYLANKDEVENKVLKHLNNPQLNEYSLHITGYSLGGAIAILSAYDWSQVLKQRNDHRQLNVLAYSSPRVGNQAFAQTLFNHNISITRYTNSDDIVLHSPLRKDGYTHLGAEIFGETLPNSTYVLKLCSQEWDEDPSCSWKFSKKVSLINHLFPMGKFAQVPPYC